MSIGLVADIPDQLIIRGVEYMMQGHAQFGYAQTGRKMTSMQTDDVNNILTKLICKLL